EAGQLRARGGDANARYDAPSPVADPGFDRGRRALFGQGRDRCIKRGAMAQLMFDDPDGTFAMLCASVAGFASRYPGPKALREKRARGGAVDKAIWSAMAEAGWTGLLLPEAIGGAGLGIREQVVLSEALGRALI